MVLTVVAIVYAAMVGGALGSFAGVVASRGLRRSVDGRSHCDACGSTLSWFELVPFASILALRARCRTCGSRFGWTPLLWELAGAALLLAIAGAVEVLATR